MNRRGFLRSMLCTAAAAVVPMPALVSEPRYFVGIDVGIASSTGVALVREQGGVLTLELFREAVATLRREAVPGPYYTFVHPDHADLFRVELEERDDFVVCDDEPEEDSHAIA